MYNITARDIACVYGMVLTLDMVLCQLNLEEPISSGYLAQPGLIGESVRPSICPIRLRWCRTNIVIDATAPQT
jgi:hypothetical protein